MLVFSPAVVESGNKTMGNVAFAVKLAGLGLLNNNEELMTKITVERTSLETLQTLLGS